MLENIKKMVMASYPAQENKGVFLSLFDVQGKLILSNGVVKSAKSLEITIETLYHGLVEKNVDSLHQLYVDVVTLVREENDMQKLFQIPLKDYGLVLSTVDGTKSAVMLPNTGGIADVKHALSLMKQKHSIDGNVLIFVFQTERFIIDKTS